MNQEKDINVDIDWIQSISEDLREQISRVIIGQDNIIEQVLILLLSGGHGLLVGVPGLAKTLLVRTIADATSLSFRRIQFTPDLMPSDITGTDVLEENPETGEREIRFVPGPIFSQVILADEINRTPPKTQAALLEAMEEGHVTAGNQTHPLPEPFFVLATQNPIEQEGTYPLPEAQMDRFMFFITMDYPKEEEELEIIRRESGDTTVGADPILDADELKEIQQQVRSIVVSEHVGRYALKLCRTTRPVNGEAPEFIHENVEWGAGPRAGLNLLLAARTYAATRGRSHVSVKDVTSVFLPVLRHRVQLNFSAQSEGVSKDEVLRELGESVSQPVG